MTTITPGDDVTDRERVIENLARAVNEFEGARERLNAALVDAVNHRCGTPARELLDLSEQTFWRRVKAAREAVGA